MYMETFYGHLSHNNFVEIPSFLLEFVLIIHPDPNREYVGHKSTNQHEDFDELFMLSNDIQKEGEFIPDHICQFITSPQILFFSLKHCFSSNEASSYIASFPSSLCSSSLL